MTISKASYYYQPKKQKTDGVIKHQLKALAKAHPRWGFDKMMASIKLDGKPWNHKRVHRIYCEEGLNIRIKPRKRLPSGEAKVLVQPIAPNVCWSLDFMSDSLYGGRKFRTLNVIDDFNREGLLIAPSHSLPGLAVTKLVDRLCERRGKPMVIRVDNGTELRSHVFQKWAKDRGILLHYIQPGKPAQNAYIERFNRTYREAVLDMHWFMSLADVRRITKEWLIVYNQKRPHESLGNITPMMAAHRYEQTLTQNKGKSTFK